MTGNETELVLPFGKHKGEPIDQVMRTDPGWVEWIMAQPWFREKHPTLVQVIVNGGALADADTPEHNRMQALFLDPAMCAAACRSIVGDAGIGERLRKWLGHRDYRECYCGEHSYRRFLHKGVEAARCAGVAPYEARIAEAEEKRKAADQAKEEVRRAAWRQQNEARKAGKPEPPDPPELIAAQTAHEQARALAKVIVTTALDKGEEAAQAEIEELLASGAEHAALFAEIAKKVEFEVGGWDVTLPEARDRELPGAAIELKPSLGDDYPAVLRKLKTRGREHMRAALIVDRFAADGASWDQVVRIFEASGFVVKTLADVRALTP